MQNLLLVNIPEAHVAAVVNELNAAGLPIESSAFLRGTVACTGSEFCKLALTETKSFARWLTEQLEERFPNYQQQLRLHITGCPNSCGQHWIADIGIEGKKIKSNGKMIDAYYFCVGGSVGQFASIARPVGYRCPATEVPNAITRLLDFFHLERELNEPLQKFLARQSTEALRSILAGGPTETRRTRPRHRHHSPLGGGPMKLFPAFLKLQNRPVLVVGGGSIAASKIPSLLDAGANVTVVAPELDDQLLQQARQNEFTWLAKLSPSTTSTTNSSSSPPPHCREVNAAVFDEAERRQILCNAVDDIDHCHFYYGSIVQRGDLQIAISTNGKSPALAQRLRKELEQQFGSEYAAWLDHLGATREQLRAQSSDPESTKENFAHLATREALIVSTKLPAAQGESADLSTHQSVAPHAVFAWGAVDPIIYLAKSSSSAPAPAIPISSP